MSRYDELLKWGPEGREAYLLRVAELNRGRGQTCPRCHATDSELTEWDRGFAYYICNNCEREFVG